MSSRGLILSTSKSLGFFLLITADQALSRFSLFKSAFNVSLVLDVPPAGDCDLPRQGGTTASCPMVRCGPVGDTRKLLCTWPSWEGWQWGATSPAAHASGPWGHLGTAVSPEAWRRMRASWLGWEPPARRRVCRAASKGSLHHQWSTEERLKQF